MLIDHLTIKGSSGAGEAAAKRTVGSEVERAIALIALAFSTDPVARWTYPEPERYLAYFPDFIRAFAGRAFEGGTAFITGDGSGAALWLPPGVSPDEEAIVEICRSTTPKEIQSDLSQVIEAMSKFHPDEPHWYLPMIGVDPQYRGMGIGSQLMEFALARCDEDGLPAYLENSNPRNTRLYERFGFKQLGVIQHGRSAPLTPMIRQARQL